MSGWYSDLLLTKNNFRDVVANFDAIIADVMDPRYISSVKILKNYGQFASAQPSTKEIIVDEDYFSGVHKALSGYSWNEKLKIVTGTILHEVAHLRWSHGDGLGMLIPEKHKNNKFANIVANIVEDRYVEERLEDEFSYTKEFISDKNECLFNDDAIEGYRNSFNGKKPTNEYEAELFIDFFLTWKRRDYPVKLVSDFEKDVYNTLQSVTYEHSSEQRKNIVGKILDMLPFIEEKNKEKEKKENLAYAVKVYSSGSDTKLKVDDVIQENDTKSFLTFQTLTNGPSLNLIKIENFDQIKHIENCKGAIRSVKGVPQYSGKKITNLSHYNQGNIFGVQTLDGHNVGKGKHEVIVLVDFSGSMGSMVPRLEGGYGSKLDFALSCVGGLYNALIDSGVHIGCYAHTTRMGGSLPLEKPLGSVSKPGPMILTISSFAKPLTKKQMHDRLTVLRERSSDIANGNADATAIIATSSLFTKKPNDKILIVISDGLPAEMHPNLDASLGFAAKINYSGNQHEKIVDYTKNVVDLVRLQRGIKIHSLSIDRKAVDANNIIYGKQFNSFVLDKQQFVNKIIESLN